MSTRPRVERILPTETEFWEPKDESDRKAPRSRQEATESGQSIVGKIAPQSRSLDFRLLKESEIDELPDPKWLIEGTLPEGAFAVLYGAAGAGKSFVALDWALSVAAGIGRSQGGPVVYIWSESPVGLKKRLRTWKQKRQIQCLPQLRVLPRAPQLLDHQQVEALIESLQAQLGQTLKLVVIDTLARCFVGGDENSAKDMGQFIAAVDRIRTATGAAVLILHHSGRNTGSERGSTALRGAADTMFMVSMKDGTITMTCDKQKDFAARKPVHLALEACGESCVVTSVSTDGLLELTEKERECLKALRSFFPAGAKHGTWRDASKLPPTTFERARAGLVKRGYVRCRDVDEVYVITDKGKYALSGKEGGDHGSATALPMEEQ